MGSCLASRRELGEPLDYWLVVRLGEGSNAQAELRYPLGCFFQAFRSQAAKSEIAKLCCTCPNLCNKAKPKTPAATRLRPVVRLAAPSAIHRAAASLSDLVRSAQYRSGRSGPAPHPARPIPPRLAHRSPAPGSAFASSAAVWPDTSSASLSQHRAR